MSPSQTRPLLMQAIMKASGMSAKQMDSNAEMKLWLATATDPTLDVQANIAALDRLEGMFGRVGTQTIPQSKPDAAAAGQPTRVKSMAEAQALKPGTKFIDPNGVERVR